MEKNWKNAVSSRFPDLVVDLQISDDGLIKRIKTGYIFTPHLKDSYHCINKAGKAIFVHHLVAETHLEPRPEGMVIDHIDGCKYNNKVSNLRYITNRENSIKGNSDIKEIPQNLTNNDKIKYLNEKINKLEEKITTLLEHLKIKE